MLETPEQRRRTAPLAVRLSNERSVHDDREPVLLMSTRSVPKYPSKDGQLRREDMKKHQHGRTTAWSVALCGASVRRRRIWCASTVGTHGFALRLD